MMVIFFIGVGLAMMSVGLFAAIYHPVGTAMLVAHADKLGREVGINGMWGNLGVASSALVTGVVCEYIGWRWAFALPGLAAIAIGVFFAGKVKHEARGNRKASSHASARVSKEAMWRVIAALVITIIASSTTFNAITVALPKLFSEHLSDLTSNTALLGVIVAATYMFGAFAQYTIGHLLDKHSLKTVFLPLALLLAPLLFFGAALSGIPLILVCICIIGTFGQVTVNDAMIGKYTSDEWCARAYSLRYFLGFTLMLQALGALCVLVMQKGYVKT